LKALTYYSKSDAQYAVRRDLATGRSVLAVPIFPSVGI
jgi:hypothetical protein